MTVQELDKIILNSKQRLKNLRAKYSELDAYLVFSSRFGQVELTTDPLKILKEFSKMYAPSPNRDRAQVLLAEITELERVIKDCEDKRKGQALKDKAEKDRELSAILLSLEFELDTQVELRFGNLDYDLIYKLQKDSLVDTKLTSQSQASIRIVLGTIWDLF